MSAQVSTIKVNPMCKKVKPKHWKKQGWAMIRKDLVVKHNKVFISRRQKNGVNWELKI